MSSHQNQPKQPREVEQQRRDDQSRRNAPQSDARNDETEFDVDAGRTQRDSNRQRAASDPTKQNRPAAQGGKASTP